jgi:hypothetical protein
MSAEGVTGLLSLTGDVIAAGAALAGLILVYLGSVATGYAGYERTQQGTVRASFQRRAWFGVVGVVSLFPPLGQRSLESGFRTFV